MAGAGFDASMIQQADGTPERSPRPRRLRLDRLGEPAGEAVQGEDRGRRCAVVRRRGELHPRRQRRTPLRRRRGVRGRTPRRRSARARSRQRRRDHGLGARARAHRRRARRTLAARPGDDGEEDQGQAEPQGSLRDRRRQLGRRSSPSRSRCSLPRSRSAYRRRSGDTVATAQPDSARRCAAPARPARDSSTRALFAILSRAGFVARALVYGIIGLLALRPGHRARRQDHEPAGRAAHRRAAVLRSPPARAACGRPRRLRALAAVPRRRSATAPRAPTAASSGSARSAAGSSTR